MEIVYEIVKGNDRPLYFNKSQPKTTLSGARIKEIPWTLPYLTESICPECLKVIKARKFVEGGRVFMEKECATHGYFKVLISLDADFYMRLFTERLPDNSGILNPNTAGTRSCPDNCGICGTHHSNTLMAVAKIMPELSLERAVDMLKILREKKPSPARSILFTGDNFSLNPHAADIICKAKNLGFSNILIADIKLISSSCKAGANAIYCDIKEINEIKPETLEICQKTGMKIILSTIITNSGDIDMASAIMKFACGNFDLIGGIFFRLENLKNLNNRYTITELIKDIASQTNNLMPQESWHSLCSLPAFAGCHPDCGAGGYMRPKIFIAAMDFQDAYNFDIERAKRCVIHSVMPNGKLFPLCSRRVYSANISAK